MHLTHLQNRMICTDVHHEHTSDIYEPYYTPDNNNWTLDTIRADSSRRKILV